MAIGRLINARFKGTCRGCGKAVPPGEPVYFAKHYGVRCQVCGPHPADSTPTPPKPGTKRYQRMKAQSAPPAERAKMAAAGYAAILESDGVYRTEFASVGEAVTDALRDYAQSEYARTRINEGQDLGGNSRWCNYFTRERLLAEVSNPSPTLLEAVNRMREHLIAEIALPVTPRRRIRRGLEDGEEIDVDRFFRRDPSCWEKSVREPAAKRNVTIGCNLAVSCSRRPEELLYRGAAALALADILTERGYNVRIVAFKACSEPTNEVNKSVSKYILKESDMPLDLSAVAFAMCEIGFTRAVVICGTMRHLPGRLNSGWGSPCNLPPADARSVDFLIEQNVLSQEKAVEWLKAQLAGQACVEAA